MPAYENILCLKSNLKEKQTNKKPNLNDSK